MSAAEERDDDRALAGPRVSRVVAKFGGECSDCGSRMHAGDVIETDDASDGWRHSSPPCEDSALEDDRGLLSTGGNPLCPACFCHHAGECL